MLTCRPANGNLQASNPLARDSEVCSRRCAPQSILRHIRLNLLDPRELGQFSRIRRLKLQPGPEASVGASGQSVSACGVLKIEPTVENGRESHQKVSTRNQRAKISNKFIFQALISAQNASLSERFALSTRKYPNESQAELFRESSECPPPKRHSKSQNSLIFAGNLNQVRFKLLKSNFSVSARSKRRSGRSSLYY